MKKATHEIKKAAHEIREIASWMAATDIEFLELRMPSATVRLGRRGGEVVSLDESECRAAGDHAAGPAEVPDCAGRQLDSLTAATVGVFLRAHPGTPAPLVCVGDRVQAGQTMGLLRIGVLLLPVAATRDGFVAVLRAADGATVGYGTALIDLHPL
jgi:acetyl-CoA carboxylase biotin carboxyl carrier protein